MTQDYETKLRRETFEEDFGLVPEDRVDLVNMVAGAFRSIRSPISYVSMPITSGKRMYEVLEAKGVRTIEELAAVDSDSIYSEIIAPNVAMGVEAADRVRSIFPPIAPSVFEGKKFRWSQQEYMALWFRVIEERAREMHMTDGWEYSNGGVQEFTRAIEMQFGFINPFWNNKNFPLVKDKEEAYENMKKIRIYDSEGKELRINDGVEMVADAIKDLDKRGFEYNSLKDSLRVLYSAAARFWAPEFGLMWKEELRKKHLAYPFEGGKIEDAWNSVNFL